MEQTWRWFGPQDRVSISDIAQAGATGVVSALHHIPAGEVWPVEDISRRQSEIARMQNGSFSNLSWTVVESLPVSEDIKMQKGDWRQHIANYTASLKNLAEAGIETVCYNFMPILDWTRTDLAWILPNGATCMRFDLCDFAVFDLHILKRPGAEGDYDASLRCTAEQRFAAMTDNDVVKLTSNIICGLPGAAETFSLEDVRVHLAEYAEMNAQTLRRHLTEFLSNVAPAAQEFGIRLGCHPDDPPFPLLGLPRIMSTEADYRAVVAAVDIPANGITFCSGALGARPDNDLPGMMTRLGGRVHALHLRNVKRETKGTRGSFYEAEHLSGDTDMVELIATILREEARRKEEGRNDWSIPFRPDHGQDILDDLGRKAQPGYPAIGRLKGLAELRGVITALESRTFVK
ncbi:MAG: mannonate dehydratase [Rhodobacteraceae bacterium]|nr:mannonate dehydratase [Paracoccaceae bacterium]MCY4195684.1 mannonate dehydratase [Paracoccaceae bacterium]MCY4326408.1 mannonate dehydratase [Paracoccaceae bacterium]